MQGKLDERTGWVTDPGHAWLRVTLADLGRVAYAPSQYSYRDERAGFAYLEEDCDAAAFLTLAGFNFDDPATPVEFPDVLTVARGEWAGRRLPSFPPSDQWRTVLMGAQEAGR